MSNHVDREVGRIEDLEIAVEIFEGAIWISIGKNGGREWASRSPEPAEARKLARLLLEAADEVAP